MANYSIDLTDSDKGFEVIPVGRYKIECTAHEMGKSKGAKTAGQPMDKWTFDIIEGEFKNRKLFLNTVHNKDGSKNFGFHSLMKATGLYKKEELLTKKFSYDPEKIIGIQFVGIVTHQDYQGEKRESLKRVESINTWKQSSGWN